MSVLAKEDINRIGIQRKWMLEKFRNVPDSGIKVEYLGKEFVVYRNVFWPHEDSKALVENFEIYPGEKVLDACTGSGVIAVFAAYKGAGHVVALDISPEAVRTAKENAELHGFGSVIDARLSDMFSAISEGEAFDVITANMPFTDEPAHDSVEAAIYDEGLGVQKKFFAGIDLYLKHDGRVYVTQSNFGALEEMRKSAVMHELSMKLIGEKHSPDDPRIFYAFELKRN